MNGHGKSDRFVVPANPPNKAAAAEAGEERERAKGNADGKTRPGRSAGPGVSSALDRVRQVARQDKEARFTALLHHATVHRLMLAFDDLKKDAAPGVDGVTWREYEQDLAANLRDLHERVQSGRYRASPGRRAYIPKADGRQRPLGIATLEDKIVQRAVAGVLSAVYVEDFRGFAYGLRPGRKPQDALDALAAGVRERFAKFGLELHPDKTRLIEFGRFAVRNRAARGEGKPETFDFLGFTHICATAKGGQFWVKRITIAKRMRAKLKQVKDQLRRRMHQPIPVQGRWLASVVRGHMAYYGVPGNSRAVEAFRNEVTRHWLKALRRRSQKGQRLTWARMRRIHKRWLPPVRVTHPFPEARFAAMHPR